jgi:hypothetical protein
MGTNVDHGAARLSQHRPCHLVPVLEAQEKWAFYIGRSPGHAINVLKMPYAYIDYRERSPRAN